MLEANPAINHILISHHDTLDSWMNRAKLTLHIWEANLEVAEWTFPVL